MKESRGRRSWKMQDYIGEREALCVRACVCACTHVHAHVRTFQKKAEGALDQQARKRILAHSSFIQA